MSPKRFVKQSLVEEAVLFVSVFKWICAAAAVGALVGLSTTVFLKLLLWAEQTTHRWEHYYWLLPAVLVVSVFLVRFFEPDAEGHGTEKVIEAVHKRAGKIKLSVVPVKLVATILTIAFGGSVGKEGPCAQIGAALASGTADLFRLEEHDRKKLVICGISAGFASVFGTPISGAIFGVEVLYAGSILYEVLLPSFVAGLVGYEVCRALGVTYFSYPIHQVPEGGMFWVQAAGAGIFLGLCSRFLIEVLKAGKSLSNRISLNPFVKAFAAGAVLLGLSAAVSDRYLGLGLQTIQDTLRGIQPPWSSFFWKSIFTSITLSFGGSGGIVTPILFIGSTAGAAFAMLFGLNVPLFAAIGLVGLLAGAANTPISAGMMAVELFGSDIAPYAAVAAVVSFLMTGHHSVYPSQVLSIRKSSSLDVQLGQEIDSICPSYKRREKTLLDCLCRLKRGVEASASKKQKME
jgi:H+/Cl- antiporter ClcA